MISQKTGTCIIHKVILYFSLIVFILPVFQLCFPVPLPLKAVQAEPHNGKIILILVDKLSLFDLSYENTPGMLELINEGSIGVASTRTLKGYNTLNAYLTIGSGNLAKSNHFGIMGFNRDELIPQYKKTAAELYENLTGFDSSSSSCLLVNLPDLIDGMKDESVTTMPGAMGQILADHGYKVCVLGNADMGGTLMRPAVGLGMDSKGQIPCGDVSSRTYISIPNHFINSETNYEYMKEQAKSHCTNNDLIIIDLGDLARYEKFTLTAFDDVKSREKKRILNNIDQYINWINNELVQEGDLLIITSPSPPRQDSDIMNKFIPLIINGPDFQSGYLSSPATRRDYIVANTDIAPTILNYFDLSANNIMIGQTVFSLPAHGLDTLAAVQDIAVNSSTVNRLRSPLIKGFVGLLILVLLLSAVAIIRFNKLHKILKPVLTAMTSVPLVLLLLGELHFSQDWLYIVTALMAVIIITALVYFLFQRNGFSAFIFLSIITVLVLNIDILSGTRLIRSSVLGYDSMAGARYYGIGNEYMGILIGSSIAVVSAFYEKFNNRWLLLLIAIFFIFQAYVIGSPSLGANSDGIITAPFAFLVTLYLFSAFRLSATGLFSIVGIILLTVWGVSYYDLQKPAELQSHIGRASRQVLDGGWQEALIIIMRKLEMNIKLIKYSIWSRVFIAILTVIAAVIYFPMGSIKDLLKRRPVMVKGSAGIVTAAIVALVVNDSGIVAASTTSIYLIIPLLLLWSDVK